MSFDEAPGIFSLFYVKNGDDNTLRNAQNPGRYMSTAGWLNYCPLVSNDGMSGHVKYINPEVGHSPRSLNLQSTHNLFVFSDPYHHPKRLQSPQ